MLIKIKLLLIILGILSMGCDAAGLLKAAQQGNGARVSVCLAKGVLPTQTDEQGKTALHLSAENGFLKIVTMLVEKGADINARDFKGRTPLFLAVQAYEDKIVKYLLSKRADINIEDKFGWTPLHVSLEHPGAHTAHLLISHGANAKARTKSSETMLHLAAKFGNNEMIVELIKLGLDVQSTDRYGRTPLHFAAAGAMEKYAELLLAKGAGINVRDKFGRTALHMVRHALMVKVLLAHKADINAQDNMGYTPRALAQRRGLHEVSKILRLNGAQEIFVKPAAENQSVMRWLTIGDKDQQVLIIKVADQQHLPVLEIDGQTELEASDQNEALFYLVSSFDLKIAKIDIISGNSKIVLPTPSPIYRMPKSPRHTWLLLSKQVSGIMRFYHDNDKQLFQVDLATLRQPLAELPIFWPKQGIERPDWSALPKSIWSKH
ncbi:MAG: ankyrin repeat domain-containing protein [Deltaproteobacteria bacterium]|nr:ankyrin repeat domain-containing protein [Deltaproteobacteria bacterium]